MSTVPELSQREAVPVDINGSVIYCEKFEAHAARSINEESTVDGEAVITGNGSRSTKLVFTGRICTDDSPEDLIISFSSLVSSAELFDIEYMGLEFDDCCMLSFDFDDSGGEWADISVSVIVNGSISRSETL